MSLKDQSWPLLFNMYIFNLATTTSEKYAYVDDLALLHSTGPLKALKATSSQDIATLSVHLKTRRLKLSCAENGNDGFLFTQ